MNPTSDILVRLTNYIMYYQRIFTTVKLSYKRCSVLWLAVQPRLQLRCVQTGSRLFYGILAISIELTKLFLLLKSLQSICYFLVLPNSFLLCFRAVKRQRVFHA